MKKRTPSDFIPMLRNVFALSLVDILDEFRTILAALLLSHPSECDRLQMQFPDDSIINFLLKSVEDFIDSDDLMNLYIDDGFFSEQLEQILETAKQDPIAGTRLMPVFCTALNESERLKLPVDLEEKIISHIEWQRQHDGFAITQLSVSGANIVYADDVSTN